MEEQTLLHDLMELAIHMRQERLFTQYELNNLQTLNEQVCKILRIQMLAYIVDRVYIVIKYAQLLRIFGLQIICVPGNQRVK